MESVRCVTNRDCTDKAGSYTVRTATASKKAMKIGLGWCRKDAMGGGITVIVKSNPIFSFQQAVQYTVHMLHLVGAVVVLCTLAASLPLLYYRAPTKERAYRMHLSIAATRSCSCSYGSTNFARVQRENESYNIPTIGASIDTMNDGQIPTSVDYMGLQQSVTASIRVPIKLSRGLLMFHHLFNDTDIHAQYSFSVSSSLELQLAARNISDTSIDSQFLSMPSSSIIGPAL